MLSQAVMEERSPVQNKDRSSNKEKTTRKSTTNASTNVNYNDFQSCQGIIKFIQVIVQISFYYNTPP